MDIKVGLTVNGQWIKADTIMLVSSSVNIYHCSFDFSKEWEPYTKTAVFCLNSGEPIETPVDNNNECVIPWECLENEGALFIGVYGVTTQDDGEMERYPTVWTKEIRVAKGVPTGTNTNDPTPSQYEQFVMEVQDAAQQAQEAAEQAQEAASSIHNYKVGHGLKLEDDGETLSVNAVNDFEGDNTLPITAAAVQASIGNIEVVLSTI